MTESQKTCHRVPDVLVDAEVEVYYFPLPPHGYSVAKPTIDERLEVMHHQVNEFNRFLEDHRRWSRVSLRVVEKREDQCSCCQRKWKPDEDKGKTFCAWCGAEVVEKGD